MPLILESNPRLLAYYRLLNGYSQKQFYTTLGVLWQRYEQEIARRLRLLLPASSAG